MQSNSIFFGMISSLLFDRAPSQTEYEIMVELQHKIGTSFDINYHEHFLKQLHGLCNVGEYEREGSSWKRIGFQREDPVSDIRGGGILCLENLIYFLSTSTTIALNMRQQRSVRYIPGQNYPWAASSISITRMLANEFSLTDKLRGTIMSRQQMASSGAYHLLLEPNAFNRLYCLVFILFDHEYTAMNGTYLTFPLVLKHTAALVHSMLQHPSTIRECAKYVSMRISSNNGNDRVDFLHDVENI